MYKLKTALAKEGKGYGQVGVVQGSVEDEMPYARMLYELLMLGETKPQVICFALEQGVNYYGCVLNELGRQVGAPDDSTSPTFGAKLPRA